MIGEIIGAIFRVIIDLFTTIVVEVLFKTMFRGFVRFGAGVWRIVTGRGWGDGRA